MLIPYLGEKSRFSDFITPNIPKNITTYVEPFGGAFGIFFSLDHSKFKNVKFIYNDINHLNHLLFKNLGDSTFIDIVKSTTATKELYLESISKISSEKDEYVLSLSWLIVLCCSSTSDVGSDSYQGDGEFEVFKLKYKAYKYHLDKISEIHNLDYKKIIEMYDSVDTFFYIDPPYYEMEKYYLNHNFTKESHQELADVLSKIKGKFILSYSMFDGLEKLYPDCKFESTKTIAGVENIIMNF